MFRAPDGGERHRPSLLHQWRPEEHTIDDLSFGIVERYRPFELVAPRFVQVDQASVGQVTSLRRIDSGPPAPFAAVELEVLDIGAAGVAAGLVSTRGDSVVATYDPARTRATIEVRRSGRVHVVARRRAVLAAPFRFAFALCENAATALADTGSGWRPLVTNRNHVASQVDLRRPEVLADHAFGVGPRRPLGGVRLGRLRAGSFGLVGVRDPHLVQHAGGEPYVRDGLLYLTLTCAGLGFFPQAHWGVFTLDLAGLRRLEQVAQLYTLRDGRILGDHAGQLVLDDATGNWEVAVSSWGDFSGSGVHVRHTNTGADILSGTHVMETEELDLPSRLSTWDPALTRIDDRWHIGYVESPSQRPFIFHPALAVGEPGRGYAAALHRAGGDESMTQCEGTVLQRLGGQWRLLASDGQGREFPVYDLAMRRLGRLDAPYLSNIPHPQVVPLPDGGHLLVTFDGAEYGRPLLGYGTHGDLVIMRAS